MKKIIIAIIALSSFSAYASEQANCYVKASGEIGKNGLTASMDGLAILCSGVKAPADIERVVKCYLDSAKEIDKAGLSITRSALGMLCSKP